MFLVLAAGPDQVELETNAIEAARRSGDVHVVKLSVIGADPGAPVRFAAAHGAVERVLADCVLPTPSCDPRTSCRTRSARRGCCARGRSPPRARRPDRLDRRPRHPAARVAALTETGHEGKVYELTGPRG